MQYDLIIIGGGPAGMMAAGRAAEKAREEGREIKILLLEERWSRQEAPHHRRRQMQCHQCRARCPDLTSQIQGQ
jgi:2-polyprenyl-6-methoxyphenol hydroxylase-like FAD-dependent oxidoreductase